jgi:integrase
MSFKPVGKLTKQWAKASQELGLNVRFHALRHTFASMMIKAGVDVLSLSRRLGHGKPSLTLDVYCHLFGNDEGKILEALNAAFSSVRKENVPALER